MAAKVEINSIQDLKNLSPVSYSGGLAYGNDSRKLCQIIRQAFEQADIPIKSVRSKYYRGARLIDAKLQSSNDTKRAKNLLDTIMPEKALWQVSW